MHKLTESIEGVFIISATPFLDNGALDLDSTDRLIDFYLDKGVNGITILGMMGEAAKLSSQESLTFLQRVLTLVDNQVPVIVGASNADLEHMQWLVNIAMDNGAAGVMVAPIPTLETEVAVFDYYATVIGSLGTDVSLCYQDYPYSTGVNLSVGCLNQLIDAFPQLVMLKHEDWPGLGKLTQIRETGKQEGHRRISILCGNSGLYLPQELARGADGAMTGFAFPEMLVGVCQHFSAGNRDLGEDLFDAYLPLVRYEQQPGFGLAVRKEILRRRGTIASAKTRAPGPELSTEDHIELDHLISRLDSRLLESGLIDKSLMAAATIPIIEHSSTGLSD